MSTLVLKPNNFEEITSIMNKKFCPKLKTEDDSVYFSLNNNNKIDEQKQNDEKNAFNQMSFLFPSIPIEVSKNNILYNILLQKIENIFKVNKNISIDEGIEQLKQLTLTENSKKKLKQNNINNINNKNNDNIKPSKKYHKFIPVKRNYNSLLIKNNETNTQNNKMSNNPNTNATNTSDHTNEILQKQQILNNEKENERIKERKKCELKTVDKVAQELLESKNENELKEYLFTQLRLLDQKKRIINHNEFIKNRINSAINQLNNDKIELRKCNTAVTRALNRKTVECFNLENKEKKLEIEINNVKDSINYHAYIGDLYNEKLKVLKDNNYDEL